MILSYFIIVVTLGGWDNSGLRVNYSWMGPNEPYSTSTAVDPIPSEDNGFRFTEDDNPVWEVVQVATLEDTKYYSCCPDEPWPILKIYMYIKRNNGDIGKFLRFLFLCILRMC